MFWLRVVLIVRRLWAVTTSRRPSRVWCASRGQQPLAGSTWPAGATGCRARARMTTRRPAPAATPTPSGLSAPAARRRFPKSQARYWCGLQRITAIEVKFHLFVSRLVYNVCLWNSRRGEPRLSPSLPPRCDAVASRNSLEDRFACRSDKTSRETGKIQISKTRTKWSITDPR